MQSLSEQKSTLRRFYISKRKALSSAEWARRSMAITDRIYQSAFYVSAETLLVYVSARDNEVDTHPLIDAALSAGKRVLIPVVGPEKGRMDWSRLHSQTHLQRGRFGLLEPMPERLAPESPPGSGLCLAPGLAFTRLGHRLGYGGGYYDRFLARFEGVSIGLAFELQMAPELPRSAEDMPVRHVVTESNWYCC